MFAQVFYNLRMFAARYFPKVGATAPPLTGVVHWHAEAYAVGGFTDEAYATGGLTAEAYAVGGFSDESYDQN